MLLGSHSIHSGMYVSDLTGKCKKKEKIRTGYFALRPYNIGVAHTLGSDPGVEENCFKPELSEEEKRELKAMLAEKGVNIYE